MSHIHVRPFSSFGSRHRPYYFARIGPKRVSANSASLVSSIDITYYNIDLIGIYTGVIPLDRLSAVVCQ